MAHLLNCKLAGIQALRWILLLATTNALDAQAVDPDPFAGLETAPSKKGAIQPSVDPFGDLTPKRTEASESTRTGAAQEAGAVGNRREALWDTSPLPGSFGGEGFTFKKEILLEISRSSNAADSPGAKAEGFIPGIQSGLRCLRSSRPGPPPAVRSIFRCALCGGTTSTKS